MKGRRHPVAAVGQATGAVATAGKPGEDDGRLKTPEISEASFIEGNAVADVVEEQFGEATTISAETNEEIAAGIDIYTNTNIVVEELECRN